MVLNITNIKDSSLVMFALVDYDYKFMFIDVECQGRISDGGVYNNSSLGNTIENDLLDLPPRRSLPISEDPEWIHDHETEFPIHDCCRRCIPTKTANNEALFSQKFG